MQRHRNGPEFEYVSLDVSDCPGMRFVVCTPRDVGSPISVVAPIIKGPV